MSLRLVRIRQPVAGLAERSEALPPPPPECTRALINVAQDGSGNVVGLYDLFSRTKWREYEYDGFGRMVAERKYGGSEHLDKIPLRHATRILDPETGLQAYRYRLYSPGLGRWLSRDPIGEAGGLNLYGMVGNNPVNAVDPLGLDWRMLTDPGSGAVGAVYYKGRWFPEMTSEVCFIGGCIVGPETPEMLGNGGVRHVTRSYVEFSSCQKSCGMELGDLHNALRNIPGALESQLLAAAAATRTALMRQYLMAAPRSVSGGIGFADGALLALAVGTNPNLASAIEPGRFRGPFGDAFEADSRNGGYAKAIGIGTAVGEASGNALLAAGLFTTQNPAFSHRLEPYTPTAGWCPMARSPTQLEFEFVNDIRPVLFKADDYNPAQLRPGEFKLHLPDLKNDALNWNQNLHELQRFTDKKISFREVNPTASNGGWLQRERNHLFYELSYDRVVNQDGVFW